MPSQSELLNFIQGLLNHRFFTCHTYQQPHRMPPATAHIPQCKAPGAGERALCCLLAPNLHAPFCGLLHKSTRSSRHQQIHSSAQHWWAFIQAPVTWSRALPHLSKFILHVFCRLELALLQLSHLLFWFISSIWQGYDTHRDWQTIISQRKNSPS